VPCGPTRYIGGVGGRTDRWNTNTPMSMSRSLVRSAQTIFLLVTVAMAGAISGVILAYAPDRANVARLDDYRPGTITRVLASTGEEIGQFATERRVIVGASAIPLVLRQAIVSSEDAAFFEHFGFDFRRMAITAAQNLLYQRRYGASTLTQQLARHVSVDGAAPLGREKVWTRKLHEAVLTIQLEKRYTKREILTFYCNQMYLGSGAYGVEAASHRYFGKRALDLTLNEAALIAGILQRPSSQNPRTSLDQAQARRNYVLGRMAANGYISRNDATQAMARPVVLADASSPKDDIAPYFVEEIRQYLGKTYGAEALYSDGLTVSTTLEPRLQRAATTAVEQGLRRLDKRQGYRAPVRNVFVEGTSLSTFDHPRWRLPVAPGESVPAVVTETVGNTMEARVGPYTTTLSSNDFAWTGQDSASALVRRGDLIDVRVVAIDLDDHRLATTLEQTPAVEGALLALDNRTGAVLAMTGGYSFQRSQFNRATQARRQLGSLFKGILFAAAIDRGYSPISILHDEPTSFDNGPSQSRYAPTNYKRDYLGPITLRTALERSRNIPAVKLMRDLGPTSVVAYARRFGFVSEIPPYLSVALGSSEATLEEITSAYTVFPNNGVRMPPFRILTISDQHGNVLEEHQPAAERAVPSDTAFVMVNLLRGVVDRGTGVAAQTLEWPVAGKTGTVDDYTDGWFVGFDPDITVGVWVGFDQKRTLGAGQDGASVALPIWHDFMRAYTKDRGSSREFSPPSNVIFTSVDATTGAIANVSHPNAIREAFIAGTEPGVSFDR